MNAKLAVGILLALVCIPVYGGIVFTPGNNPQPDEENIMFEAQQTGHSVLGITNQTDTTVRFQSSIDVLFADLGVAKVTATDGLLNRLTISTDQATFNDLIINPLGPLGTPLRVIVWTNDNSNGAHYDYPDGLKEGSNYLTITTDNGTRITAVTLVSGSGLDQLGRVRISGVAATIPEPGTFGLMLMGASGLLWAYRRRR